MEHLNIDNICGGALREVFERELREILKNIKDPNTPAQAKRTMSFTLTFKPFVDRSGAEIELRPKHTVAPLDAVRGNIYVSGQSSADVKAYPRDPRQDVLFTEQNPSKV